MICEKCGGGGWLVVRCESVDEWSEEAPVKSIPCDECGGWGIHHWEDEHELSDKKDAAT